MTGSKSAMAFATPAYSTLAVAIRSPHNSARHGHAMMRRLVVRRLGRHPVAVARRDQQRRRFHTDGR